MSIFDLNQTCQLVFSHNVLCNLFSPVARGETGHYAVLTLNFGIFLTFPYFLRHLKSCYTRYQAAFYLW